MASGQRRAGHLDAMREASAALTSELDLSAVLQRVVDLSRSLVNARYAALGVLNEEGAEIEQFITAGIPHELRAQLGAFPRGHGLLGTIIREGRTIRVDNIDADRRSSGDPPHHPHMHTFIGVPIISKGRVFGNLYLTDKRPSGAEAAREKATQKTAARKKAARKKADADAQEMRSGTADEADQYPPFTEEDEETLELFAMQAAIAIENARLHRRNEQLAIAKERERFAMDLHDGIIQSIYAVGLTLDDGRFYLETEPARAKERLDQAMGELDTVIADLRAYIMNLEPQRFRERDLATGLAELARELRAGSFLRVEVEVDPAAANAAAPDQVHQLLHIVQEALTNAHKHARGTSVRVTLGLVDECLRLTVEDDGVGLRAAAPSAGAGNGLPNMEQRAAKIGGTFSVESKIGRGTRVAVLLPVASGALDHA